MLKSRHVYFNPNPSKKEVGDCVVRALCKALDMDWETVYWDLCNLGLDLKRMPNSRDCYRTYLTNAGYRRTGISNKKGSTRPTVESFASNHCTGTYILEVANHVVTIHDGKYYDIWDCGFKCLYGYWAKAV